MNAASFEVEVTPETAREFATLSGDWNPLHTDPGYAATTPYQRCILHGAYSAGLVSRMAGMHLPGTACLLHSMNLRFLSPIFPPSRLRVEGSQVSDRGEVNRVEITISDCVTGRRYVEGSYEFSRHEAKGEEVAKTITVNTPMDEAVVLVTGATGGLGQALLRGLGKRGLGLARGVSGHNGAADDRQGLSEALGGRKIAAIVHCGWPPPDNTQLLGLPDVVSAISCYIGAPLRQVLMLAKALSDQGTANGLLLLVGSTAALPGRHNFRAPLYSLGKAMLSPLSSMLALELGSSGRRCVTVEFDIIDAGMSSNLSRFAKQAHADRLPSGHLPSAEEAARQLLWVLDNGSNLVSGATLRLSGGAMP